MRTDCTGIRSRLIASLPPDLVDYVRRVRSLTTVPLILGFGISKQEHAHTVAQFVDGIAVGAALIRSMENDGLEGVKKLALELRAGCQR